ncbi:pumilio homolog 18-like [Sesamum indicum]|uniref:Pumilio homolog 18-like n=1 Tax=Sesamum indicum TaxID=4182 RepID=A0A6I9UHR4_SESIN|nr:pumilio homolog 18-like [Sesamum indicum]
MDSSTSPTRLNPTDHEDEEVILYIGRLQPGKDGTFWKLAPTADSQSNNGDAPSLDDDSDTFSVFSFKTQEEGVPITTTRSKKMKFVPCVLGEDNSATKDGIWGCPRFFMTTSEGEKNVINEQNLMDHQHRSNHLVHHLRSRLLPVPYADPRFRPMMLHKFRYPMKYGPRIPIRPPPFLQARPLDVNHLDEIMKGDDRKQKESLVSILLHSIFTLMLNRRLHCIYCMLVDACEGQQLDSLVVRVLSQGEYFLRAAFDQQGASSIVELIKKVKKSSPHAMAMTRVLSTRFMDIMTHPTARDVILQCLLLFPAQPNEVLYEKAILHFQDLAVHEVGCRSLNDCIAHIDGHQRVRLLNHIADVSDFLSYDPYGNGDITNKITDCLENQFIRLAVRKEGSLVVEKCMEASNNGIIKVAAEIVNYPGAAFRLARNKFGNYVIQAALKKTKECGFKSFYDAIVRCLEPCRRALRQTADGKNVLSVVEADEQYSQFN